MPLLPTETDFETVYAEGQVLAEDKYHQPDKGYDCGCELTTSKGAYKEVVVFYNATKYYYLHQNLILVEQSPNEFIITDGGHKTKMTKKTLNKMLPSELKIIQRDYDWYIEVGDERIEFNSRMAVSIE